MIDIGWLLLFNTWFFSLLITTISAVQAVVKCVCGWVRQMFTHKTKACVSPAVVSMAVDSGGGGLFFLRNDFWKRDGKNARGTFWRDRRLSRRRSGKVVRSGGREENYSRQQNPPGRCIWAAQCDGLWGLFFFYMSFHVDCSCLILRTQKLILLRYDCCCRWVL